MSTDLNQITIIGRLTRDPEMRQIPSGQNVCNFSIANNKTFVSNGAKREDVSFFNCVAWGRLAEIINQYCQKGKQIAVSGRLSQSSYDDKEGRKVSKVEIVVESMQLLGNNNSNQDSQSGQNNWSSQPAPQQPAHRDQNQGNTHSPTQHTGTGAGYQNPAQQNHNEATGSNNYSEDDIPF